MAKRRRARRRSTITIRIINKVPGDPKATATVGDTIQFLNTDGSARVVKIASDETGSRFHPFGLYIPSGAYGSIYAVNSKSGNKSDTAYYSIETPLEDSSARPHTRDDTYQVIVGSSRTKRRK